MGNSSFEQLKNRLSGEPRSWLVTGIAGFIGSNLALRLLELGQKVSGIDNFSSGSRINLEALRAAAPRPGNFCFREGDIRNPDQLQLAMQGVDFVLHQAALGSVPRSLKDPLGTSSVNLLGTQQILSTASACGVKRVVYASSSSVYGDSPEYPMREETLGAALSPYALSKRCCELSAGIWERCFGLDTVGLRYFNVFGPRQSAQGPYSAVIPLWISALRQGRECLINGDGSISRDFCYVENVVQANLLAASGSSELRGKIFNIACGDEMSLNELHACLADQMRPYGVSPKEPRRGPERPGDLRRSRADISAARRMLGYEPVIGAKEGLKLTLEWFLADMNNCPPRAGIP